MKVTQLLAAIVAVGTVAGVAMAQQTTAKAGGDSGYLKEGTWEVGFNGGGSLWHARDRSSGYNGGRTMDSTILNAAGQVAYFIIDNLAIGAALNVNYFITKNGSVDWDVVPPPPGGAGAEGGDLRENLLALSVEGVIRYHVPVCANIIPYVGVQGGPGYIWATRRSPVIGKATDDDTMWTYGGQVGFKVPINDNVYFDTQLKYSWFQLPSSRAMDISATQLLLGLKIKL
jgi:outer membrane protein W